jgi:hypothetical protein
MWAVPENPLELMTFREAVTALEESIRGDAADVLKGNPDAPPHHTFNGSRLYQWQTLAKWADDLWPDDHVIDNSIWVPVDLESLKGVAAAK